MPIAIHPDDAVEGSLHRGAQPSLAAPERHGVDAAVEDGAILLFARTQGRDGPFRLQLIEDGVASYA
ncbi:MAG TPA: hypothetical protein VFP68_08425 [Burkholderiaceae bacterium]|nr:hypothetical protein [Burkholderiaceae bacterium]